jgi:hypothetical protein
MPPLQELPESPCPSDILKFKPGTGGRTSRGAPRPALSTALAPVHRGCSDSSRCGSGYSESALAGWSGSKSTTSGRPLPLSRLKSTLHFRGSLPPSSALRPKQVHGRLYARKSSHFRETVSTRKLRKKSRGLRRWPLRRLSASRRPMARLCRNEPTRNCSTAARRFSPAILLQRWRWILRIGGAAKFSQAAEIWREEKRQALAANERLGVISGVILGGLALISMALVRGIVLRLRRATSNLQLRVAEQERRGKEEEALREVAHILTAAVNLDDVLRRITETAALAAEADGVIIQSIDAARNEIKAVAARGAGVPPVGTKGTYIGSFAERAIRDGTPLIIADVRSEIVRYTSLIDADAATCAECSGLVVPLLSDEDPLGVLVLLRQQPRIFTPRDFPRLQILGDMAAVGMRRGLMLEELQNLHAQEQFLSAAAAILASSLDYNSTLKALARLSVPRVADCCLVHLVENNGTIRIVEVAHVDPEKMPFAQQLGAKFPPQPNDSSGAFRVIRSGKPELFSEITPEMCRRSAQNEDHLGSCDAWISTPLSSCRCRLRIRRSALSPKSLIQALHSRGTQIPLLGKGGVDATSKKYREATLVEAAGVVG